MPTRKTCDIEPFRYQATPQNGPSNDSANEINQQSLENYLNRLKTAVCADIDSILAECCGGGGGGGVTTFLELTDTPSAYTGSANKVVSVNPGATALEFTTPSSGPDSDGLTLDLSTTEQATNRTDTAGATIYQKTISFGALPNTASKDVAHGITGLANLYRVDAVSYDPTANNRLPLPFCATALAGMIALAVNATNVRITTGNNRTSYTTTYVTLFYTKS